MKLSEKIQQICNDLLASAQQFKSERGYYTDSHWFPIPFTVKNKDLEYDLVTSPVKPDTEKISYYDLYFEPIINDNKEIVGYRFTRDEFY